MLVWKWSEYGVLRSFNLKLSFHINGRLSLLRTALYHSRSQYILERKTIFVNRLLIFRTSSRAFLSTQTFFYIREIKFWKLLRYSLCSMETIILSASCGIQDDIYQSFHYVVPFISFCLGPPWWWCFVTCSEIWHFLLCRKTSLFLLQ